MTSVNDSVATPAWLYEALDAEFHFDHDPCPLDPNPAVDGLVQPWGRSNYVNPPYSNIAPWIARAIREMDERGARTVFLVPAKTSTRCWRDMVFPRASEIRFLDRRLCFAGYEAAFPNSLAILVFDPAVPAPARRRVAFANGYHHVST